MNSAEIRESFLTFFESKGCRRWPSSSLVPDDPSLLLTTAGMVQFKPVFLGLHDLGFTRATTVQKCVRTTDIDIIGTTGRHHSFFEMLGNFSFGDYFKKEACSWAYEYSVGVLGLDPDRLWYSIYEDDDESLEIWRDIVGVPVERIVRMGEKDNFWSAGPTGPCGPCSELYYDQGPDVGCGSASCAPGCDCDRFLEYWNLVFMQYDRGEDGTLAPLPKQNIDTGMGLERIAAILQGVKSNFETDIIRGIIAVAEGITGAAFGVDQKTDTSLRIIADHARSVAFLIADGVVPSNEGRGYVLRRLLRRAVRHGRLLGVERAFMNELVTDVIGRMGAAYPELVEHRELVEHIVTSEEARFSATLRQGLALLEEALEAAAALGATSLDGATAFALHDTFGFPVELTAEIAAEAGVDVDMATFEVAMSEQRERGRAAVKDESWAQSDAAFTDVGKSTVAEFVGYEVDEVEAHVTAIVVDGVAVQRVDAGVRGEIVLDRTPFYGEQGGQVGDTGTITTDDGATFGVEDTRIPVPGVVAHLGVLDAGVLTVGDRVHAAIDVRRRERIRRNHTCTHILQWALRRVVGEHVHQAGSLVAPDRLRFDFTHFEALTAEQLGRVERLVNAKIMENHPVRAYETSLATARESGVTALFGEKYGEFVRVLEIGNFSKELCAGTHIARTSEINLVKIVSESSVGANMRRIEAVTSFDALEAVAANEAVLDAASGALKCRASEVAERVEQTIRRAKEAEAACAELKRFGASGAVDELVAGATDVGYPLVVAAIDVPDAGALRDLADLVRGRLVGGAVVFAAAVDGKALLLAAAAEAAVAQGFDAGAVIKAIAPSVGGGGGGRPMMAQAGGKDPSGIEAALTQARAMLGAV